MNDQNKSKEDLILELEVLRENLKTIRTQVESGKFVENEGKNQAEITNSDALNRSILDASPDVITITDLLGNVLLTSPRTAEMYGLSEADDFKGLTVFDFLDKSDHAKAVGLMAKMYEGPQGMVEYLAKKRDGTRFEVEVNSDFIRDSNGNPINILIIQRDISQRKRIEEKLHKSEETYRNLVESINDVIYEMTLDGTIIYISPAIEKIAGYTTEELIGTNVFRIVYHEDIPGLLKRLGTNNEKELRFYDLRFVSKEGNLLWVRSLPTNVIVNGIVVGRKGILSDITQQKFAEIALRESEASLNYAQEIAKMGSWEHNLVTNKMTCSKNYCKVMGLCAWEGDENLYDRFILTVLPEDLKLVEYLQKNSYSENKTEQVDIRIIMPDGTIKCVRNNVNPVFEDGKLIALKGVNIDVTEQKLNEEKIRHQNDRLKAILESIPDLIFVVSKDGTYLEYYSSETDRLVIPDDQIIGKNIRSLFNEETATLHLQEIDKCLEKQKIVTYEFSGVVANSESFFEVRLAPLGNDRVLTVARDITDKKKNEDNLKDSEEKYRFMFFNNPQPMWIYDLETLAFLEVNASAIEHYGYTRREFLSMTLKDIRPVEDIDELLKDIRNTKKPLNIAGEWRHLKKNGETIHVEIVSHSITYNGRNARHILVNDTTRRKQVEQEIRDLNSMLEKRIAERTVQLEESNISLTKQIEVRKQMEQALFQSEKNYRTVVENVNEVIFRTDVNGLWLFLNSSWSKLTGFSVTESLGQSFLDYIHPDDRQLNLDYFRPLIMREKEYCHHEVRYLTKGGETLWIEVFARLGLDENGEITGTFGTLQDITLRKEAIEEIKKARSEAEQANMAKSEFLSRMSHELRTPMNSILGFAQLLQMGQLTAGQMKGVSHIVQSGKHLLNLINEVLDISRIEAGHLTLSLEPILLSLAITETMDILKPMCYDRQIKLEQTYFPDNKIHVNSDHQRLKQILLNLLTNAVKYNKMAGNILVKAEKKPPEPNGSVWVRISITDTGLGIAADDIPKLFKPFERIGAEKTVTEGTGLGLAVVKKLLEAMGGIIGVESGLGTGSTFWIELPFSENQTEAIKGAGSSGPDSGDRAQTGTILYIEDNASNIDLVEQILASHRPGILVISDIHGSSAVGLATLHHPELILLDLDLPDIHGSEVIKRLKANDKTRDIPVVVVSADAMQHQLDRLMQLGAANYLAKPIDVIVFLSIIDKLIK